MQGDPLCMLIGLNTIGESANASPLTVKWTIKYAPAITTLMLKQASSDAETILSSTESLDYCVRILRYILCVPCFVLT